MVSKADIIKMFADCDYQSVLDIPVKETAGYQIIERKLTLKIINLADPRNCINIHRNDDAQGRFYDVMVNHNGVAKWVKTNELPFESYIDKEDMGKEKYKRTMKFPSDVADAFADLLVKCVGTKKDSIRKFENAILKSKEDETK
jgi:hypothetical protein